MIKKFTILTIIVAVVAMSGMADNRNNKNNKRRSPKIVYVEDEPKNEYVEPLTFNDIDQIYGEWDVVEIKGDKVELPRGSRAYLFFDTHMRNNEAINLYGNTGVNGLNASFKINGNKLNVYNVVTTTAMGGYPQRDVERAMLEVLKKEKNITLEMEGESEYMLLKEKKNVVMKLRKQDLDFMNGSWKVTKINDKDVEKCGIMLVNDIDMKKVNIFSGENIVNGVIYIDPSIDHGIEFEDLISTRNQWRYIDTETRLLIALEETQYCRKNKYNDREVVLCTKEVKPLGKEEEKVLVVLERL